MPEETIKLLVVEDESFDVERIKRTIKSAGDDIEISDIVSNGRDALAKLESKSTDHDVIILDYQIAGGLRGEELISRFKTIDPTVQIIVITKMTINQTDLYFAKKLIEHGAYWYCTKYPIDIDDYIYSPTDFILSIINAYEKRSLEKEQLENSKIIDQKIQDIVSKKPIIGDSNLVRKMKEEIAQCGENSAAVLITGESGVGKELVAVNIHYGSKRRLGPFVPINCAAIPADLIESELFGYEKGSFTGANARKAGLFEQADGGTIFLDEIGQLSDTVQAKLLRVLETGEIDKIGRQKLYTVDVRVVAATNDNLEEMAAAKKFRLDLYYRINVLQIRIPSLRERGDDIVVLADYFLSLYSREMGMKTPVLESDAKKEMNKFPWPGNVRQLKSIVQRMLLGRPNIISTELAREILGQSHTNTLGSNGGGPVARYGLQPLKEVERLFRREYFESVLDISKSDAEAARTLGLAPPNFHRMCKDLELK